MKPFPDDEGSLHPVVGGEIVLCTQDFLVPHHGLDGLGEVKLDVVVYRILHQGIDLCDRRIHVSTANWRNVGIVEGEGSSFVCVEAWLGYELARRCWCFATEQESEPIGNRDLFER